MKAEDMIIESQRAAVNERVRLQREFLQALQQAVAKAEVARLLMLLRIGGALFGESDAARNDCWRWRRWTHATSRYSPLGASCSRQARTS